MKTKTSRTKTFNSKLAAYSATATAALMIAPAADATIQNITEFSYDGGSSFTTTPPSLFLNSIGRSQKKFSAGPLVGNLIVGQSIFSTNNLRRLALLNSASLAGSDSAIGRIPLHGTLTGHSFGFIELAVQSSSLHGGPGDNSNFGNFLPSGDNGVVSGYVGFKANHNAQTYYGWLRVKVGANADGLIDAVSLIAKDGDPTIFGAFGLKSDNILAGETASPVPEPSVAAIGGLGLLALGATGVREMRRRRKA